MAKKTLAEKMAENSKFAIESLKSSTIGSFSSTEMIKKNIIILDELRDLIPPLLSSELESLRDNLQKHGCKDPLKVWQTNNKVLNRDENPDEVAYVLIDGHNRYRLCNELQIPFNIQIDSFDSIKEVRDFMIDFQLSRRNLNAQQTSYLRGLRYNTEKKAVIENLKTSIAEVESPNGQNVHQHKTTSKTTAQELGDYFNVDEKTIRRDAEYARGLEKLSPTVRKDILAGKVKVEKAKIQQLGKIKELDKTLESLDEVEAIVETTKKSLTTAQSSTDDTELKSKYDTLIQQLKRSYQSKTLKDIDATKEAFEQFIRALA